MTLQGVLHAALLRLASLILAACFIVVVVAAVPAAVLGQFSLIAAAGQVLAAVLLAWPNQATLRYGREALASAPAFGRVIGTRLALHGILLAVLGVGVALFGPTIGRWYGIDGLVAASLIFGLAATVSLGELGNVIAQTTGSLAGFGLAPLIVRAGQLLAALAILLGIPASVEMLGGGTVVAYGAGALAAWWVLRAEMIRFLGISWPVMRQLVGYSWSLPLVATSITLFAVLDLWIIEYFHGLAATGTYALSYYVLTLATAVLTPLSAVLAPRAIDESMRRDQVYRRRALEAASAGATCLSFLVLAAVPVLMAAFSYVDLRDYHAALVPAAILAGAIPFQLLFAVGEPIVFVERHLVEKGTAAMMLMAAANGLIDLALVPSLGLTGAALGTTAALAIGSTVMWGLAEKAAGPLPWRFRRAILYAGIAAACLSIATYLSPPWGIGLGVASALLLALAARHDGTLVSLEDIGRRVFSGSGSAQSVARRALSWLAAPHRRERAQV